MFFSCYHVHLGRFYFNSPPECAVADQCLGYCGLAFSLAFLILMPILLYRKEAAFTEKEPFILAMIGGVIYCLFAYSAFHYAPTAHAAIFLNGCIPICTAIMAFF